MALKSGFEKTLNLQLKQSGITFTYETLQLPYTLSGTYNPDFILSNGIIIEAKGRLDRENKRKMEAIKRQYPDLDLRIVFMDGSKKIPGYKQSHGDWATRHKFIWAERQIPGSWLI